MAKLKTIEGTSVTGLRSGNMYFYRYRAEPTVPTYDVYPLIFMIRKRGSVIEGINFHYMGIERRINLLNEMKPFFSTKNLIESDTRLIVKRFRDLLLVSRKLRDAKIALHRYRIPNIISKVIRIEPSNWEFAIKEPVQKFITNTGKKRASGSVWRKTLKQSKKG
jgi:hypothetical protein